jgi:hypothetical protein
MDRKHSYKWYNASPQTGMINILRGLSRSAKFVLKFFVSSEHYCRILVPSSVTSFLLKNIIEANLHTVGLSFKSSNTICLSKFNFVKTIPSVIFCQDGVTRFETFSDGLFFDELDRLI